MHRRRGRRRDAGKTRNKFFRPPPDPTEKGLPFEPGQEAMTRERRSIISERIRDISKDQEMLRRGRGTPEERRRALRNVQERALKWTRELEKGEIKGINSRVKGKFEAAFRDWLVGLSKYNLQPGKTPWGNKTLMTLPGVRQYVLQTETQYRDYALYYKLLRDVGPQTLNEAYLYFKYFIFQDDIEFDHDHFLEFVDDVDNYQEALNGVRRGATEIPNQNNYIAPNYHLPDDHDHPENRYTPVNMKNDNLPWPYKLANKGSWDALPLGSYHLHQKFGDITRGWMAQLGNVDADARRDIQNWLLDDYARRPGMQFIWRDGFWYKKNNYRPADSDFTYNLEYAASDFLLMPRWAILTTRMIEEWYGDHFNHHHFGGWDDPGPPPGGGDSDDEDGGDDDGGGDDVEFFDDDDTDAGDDDDFQDAEDGGDDGGGGDDDDDGGDDLLGPPRRRNRDVEQRPRQRRRIERQQQDNHPRPGGGGGGGAVRVAEALVNMLDERQQQMVQRANAIDANFGAQFGLQMNRFEQVAERFEQIFANAPNVLPAHVPAQPAPVENLLDLENFPDLPPAIDLPEPAFEHHQQVADQVRAGQVPQAPRLRERGLIQRIMNAEVAQRPAAEVPAVDPDLADFINAEVEPVGANRRPRGPLNEEQEAVQRYFEAIAEEARNVVVGRVVIPEVQVDLSSLSDTIKTSMKEGFAALAKSNTTNPAVAIRGQAHPEQPIAGSSKSRLVPPKEYVRARTVEPVESVLEKRQDRLETLTEGMRKMIEDLSKKFVKVEDRRRLAETGKEMEIFGLQSEAIKNLIEKFEKRTEAMSKQTAQMQQTLIAFRNDQDLRMDRLTLKLDARPHPVGVNPGQAGVVTLPDSLTSALQAQTERLGDVAKNLAVMNERLSSGFEGLGKSMSLAATGINANLTNIQSGLGTLDRNITTQGDRVATGIGRVEKNVKQGSKDVVAEIKTLQTTLVPLLSGLKQSASTGSSSSSSSANVESAGTLRNIETLAESIFKVAGEMVEERKAGRTQTVSNENAAVTKELIAALKEQRDSIREVIDGERQAHTDQTTKIIDSLTQFLKAALGANDSGLRQTIGQIQGQMMGLQGGSAPVQTTGVIVDESRLARLEADQARMIERFYAQRDTEMNARLNRIEQAFQSMQIELRASYHRLQPPSDAPMRDAGAGSETVSTILKMVDNQNNRLEALTQDNARLSQGERAAQAAYQNAVTTGTMLINEKADRLRTMQLALEQSEVAVRLLMGKLRDRKNMLMVEKRRADTLQGRLDDADADVDELERDLETMQEAYNTMVAIKGNMAEGLEKAQEKYEDASRRLDEANREIEQLRNLAADGFQLTAEQQARGQELEAEVARLNGEFEEVRMDRVNSSRRQNRTDALTELIVTMYPNDKSIDGNQRINLFNKVIENFDDVRVLFDEYMQQMRQARTTMGSAAHPDFRPRMNHEWTIFAHRLGPVLDKLTTENSNLIIKWRKELNETDDPQIRKMLGEMIEEHDGEMTSALQYVRGQAAAVIRVKPEPRQPALPPPPPPPPGTAARGAFDVEGDRDMGERAVKREVTGDGGDGDDGPPPARVKRQKKEEEPPGDPTNTTNPTVLVGQVQHLQQIEDGARPAMMTPEAQQAIVAIKQEQNDLIGESTQEQLLEFQRAEHDLNELQDVVAGMRDYVPMGIIDQLQAGIDDAVNSSPSKILSGHPVWSEDSLRAAKQLEAWKNTTDETQKKTLSLQSTVRVAAINSLNNGMHLVLKTIGRYDPFMKIKEGYLSAPESSDLYTAVSAEAIALQETHFTLSPKAARSMATMRLAIRDTLEQWNTDSVKFVSESATAHEPEIAKNYGPENATDPYRCACHNCNAANPQRAWQCVQPECLTISCQQHRPTGEEHKCPRCTKDTMFPLTTPIAYMNVLAHVTRVMPDKRRPLERGAVENVKNLSTDLSSIDHLFDSAIGFQAFSSYSKHKKLYDTMHEKGATRSAGRVQETGNDTLVELMKMLKVSRVTKLGIPHSTNDMVQYTNPRMQVANLNTGQPSMQIDLTRGREPLRDAEQEDDIESL